MKRTVIIVDGSGRLSIPSSLERLWTSENELVEMSLAKNGRIFDASVIYCRIDLLTY